jgi:hypothetical protein
MARYPALAPAKNIALDRQTQDIGGRFTNGGGNSIIYLAAIAVPHDPTDVPPRTIATWRRRHSLPGKRLRAAWDDSACLRDQDNFPGCPQFG